MCSAGRGCLTEKFSHATLRRQKSVEYVQKDLIDGKTNASRLTYTENFWKQQRVKSNYINRKDWKRGGEVTGLATNFSRPSAK